MKIRLLIIVGCLLCAVSTTQARTASPRYTLAKNGVSNWRIVLGADASPSEKHGAAELQHFVQQMSGAKLPIVSDSGPVKAHEIILGDNAHLQKLHTAIDFSALGNEGYAIRTVGDDLVIAGGRQRGTMYGVYALLEETFGCHWLSSNVSVIPHRPTLQFGTLNKTGMPRFINREIFYYDALDPDWAARNRLNGRSQKLTPEQGGKFGWADPPWHTSFWLLPPDQYFKDHPEYYAMDRSGHRQPTQLDTTNPDVVRLVTAKVEQWMHDNPDDTAFSVTQMDNDDWSRDPQTLAEVQKYGTPSGPFIEFVNKIGVAVEKDYPDKYLVTFAYNYTLQAPKLIRPRKNVYIEFCTYGSWIECRDALYAWQPLTDQMFVWDYATSFTHYLTPNPNLYKLRDDIRFFSAHHVQGVFEEGDYQSPGGEFAELRAYLIAKLLWDPNYDIDKGIKEFTDGYYGDAAPFIRQYIALLHAPVRGLNIETLDTKGPAVAKTVRDHSWELTFLGMQTMPYPSSFLNPGRMKTYEALFGQAEAMVADQPDVLLRVQVAHLPIQMIQVLAGTPHDPQRAKTMDRFFAVADKAHITMFNEGMSMAAAKQRALPTR